MKLIFVSCMDAERVPTQPVWKKIQSEKPDVLLLLGDQLYMDWGDLAESNLKKTIARHPAAGLEAFAREMHRRYELQWAVIDFQHCVQSIVERGGQVLITWDDHDFAWNNSFRQGSTDEIHAVPRQVMDVSKRLFTQFKQHITSPDASQAYPNLPNDWNLALPNAEPGNEIQTIKLNSNGIDVPLQLLDTRWYRTSKANPHATILGQAQAAALFAAAAKPKGLLILAAGTPLVHEYLFANDAWASQRTGEPSYPEYEQLLKTAKRPVLYLSGDIHRNAWGGVLKYRQAGLAQDIESTVIQVLSSGAAIGAIGAKTVSPNIGIITITTTLLNSGAAQVQLLTQVNDASWQASPPCPQALHYNANAWEQTYPGESYGNPSYVIDTTPLSSITVRQRTHAFDREPLLIREDLDSFDQYVAGGQAVFTDRLLPHDSPLAYADACWIRGSPSQGVIIERPNSTAYMTDFQRNIDTIIQDAFVRASDAGKQSVVFYIHGLGKSHAQALEQAYSLRALYPNSEPIAFTWPSGGDGRGLFAALNSYATALRNAAELSPFLNYALIKFSKIGLAFPMLRKVILARSAGCAALNQAFSFAQLGSLAPIDAIVLSAPLLKHSAFLFKRGFFMNLNAPIWVTFNQHDSTLSKADWANFKIGEILGLKGSEGIDPSKLSSKMGFLDFTLASSVNRLHDYLLTPIQNAHTLHAALLSGTPPQLCLYGTPISPTTWQVH